MEMATPASYEHAGNEVQAGELAALVGVMTISRASCRMRRPSPRVRAFEAETWPIQGRSTAATPGHGCVAQSMIATRYKNPTSHWDIGDVGAPHRNVIGADATVSAAQQIRIMARLRGVRRRAGLRLLRSSIRALKAHQPHQAPNTVTADPNTFPPQLARHLPATVEGISAETTRRCGASAPGSPGSPPLGP